MKKILLIPILLLAASACQYKELCYDHAHAVDLTVGFDWGGQDATSVRSMSLLLYPEDGSAPLRFPFSDIRGGKISVPARIYNVLCMNDDELLHLQDANSWESVSVTTGETSLVSRAAFNNTRVSVPRAKGSEQEFVLREPPLLFTDSQAQFQVRYIDESQTLQLAPEMPLGQIHIRIEAVENSQYIRTLSGSVSGLASSLDLTTLQPSGEPCTMPISLTLADDGHIEGWLNYFGHCPSGVQNHSLTVYTMLVDGTKQANVYDITAQMHAGTQTDKKLEITIPLLPLPTPEPVEGGYDISLDDWTVTSIDIKM